MTPHKSGDTHRRHSTVAGSPTTITSATSAPARRASLSVPGHLLTLGNGIRTAANLDDAKAIVRPVIAYLLNLIKKEQSQNILLGEVLPSAYGIWYFIETTMLDELAKDQAKKKAFDEFAKLVQDKTSAVQKDNAIKIIKRKLERWEKSAADTAAASSTPTHRRKNSFAGVWGALVSAVSPKHSGEASPTAAGAGGGTPDDLNSFVGVADESSSPDLSAAASSTALAAIMPSNPAAGPSDNGDIELVPMSRPA